MTPQEKFELAMREEKRFAALEYSAVSRNQHDEAAKHHAMRWKMMDKAVQFIQEGN